MNTVLKVFSVLILSVVLCLGVSILHMQTTNFIRSEVNDQVKHLKACQCNHNVKPFRPGSDSGSLDTGKKESSEDK